MSDFIKQITDVELLVINKPRTFIIWRNTEKGRDIKDCYERIDWNTSVHYINTYNTDMKVFKDVPFFNVLEEIYQKLITEGNNEEN